MKLILSGDRIAATALDSHVAASGQAVIDAPGDFDPARAGAYRWREGALVLPERASLPAARAAAVARIDAEAEHHRARVLTPGAGQSLEYQQTRAEAERLAAAGGAGAAGDYPMLEAERLALDDAGQAATLADVAGRVLVQRDAWTTYGAAIKRARRAAKLAVMAAATVAEVEALAAGIAWPDPPGA
ncbi:hypothetical protein [Roseospira visakhapatnamensis]|uniref:DUF4376 domain-containing protein n=1 Tax=Roseospira visakhapatnamensis TaxID=390880 RepID=A0A7W6W8T3_9PROT|nr:hypothetical protein [Roseospira visakhapatnamensis]MBB4265189.1 hypothetical protein [Roseospira visakhapatnamensis]